MGQLRNKCVLEMDPYNSEWTGNWTEWVINDDHWFYSSRGPELCGNASGARSEDISIPLFLSLSLRAFSPIDETLITD